MRMEGSKEFRISCEDAGEFPIRVITPGFCMAKHMIASVPEIKGSKIAMEKGE